MTKQLTVNEITVVGTRQGQMYICGAVSGLKSVEGRPVMVTVTDRTILRLISRLPTVDDLIEVRDHIEVQVNKIAERDGTQSEHMTIDSRAKSQLKKLLTAMTPPEASAHIESTAKIHVERGDHEQAALCYVILSILNSAEYVDGLCPQ